MSHVTNLMIIFSCSEDVEDIIREINRFRFNGHDFNIVSIDDQALPGKWYGGSKRMEAEVLVGAYNHLPLSDLLSFLKKIHWQNPEDVQVLYKTEQEFKFTLIDLVDA